MKDHLPSYFPRLGVLLVLFPLGMQALEPTEWQFRQTIPVSGPGLIRVVVPPQTFDVAQPDLSDLRLLNSHGQEVPYVISREFSAPSHASSRSIAPTSFRATPLDDTTQLLIETGTSEAIESVNLETPVPFFLKAAHVEFSSDQVHWESLGPAMPAFRQFGAEQLSMVFPKRTAKYIRVTLDDFRSRKVTFTGATLLVTTSQSQPPILSPLGVKILRRDEFVGETALTLELEGRHVPVASLSFDVQDPLFVRRVEATIRENRGSVSTEQIVATGTIYRVALEGTPARSQMSLPVEFSPTSRELLVHIQNGDSPPLKLGAVEAEQYPVSILFNAEVAGDFALLSGNPQATPPRYDLSVFTGEMRAANASTVLPNPLEKTPSFRPRESLAETPLPDVPLSGAPLDTTSWTHRHSLVIAKPGVQELELNPESLSLSRHDGADLRVIRDGNQIPFEMERPDLSRSIELEAIPSPDPQRPSTSLWQIRLPESGLPIQRLALTTTTPLFQRHFRIYEKQTTTDGRIVQIPLASEVWSRTPEPGVSDSRTFEFQQKMRSDTLWIETDNGDNPPLALTSIRAIYPVVRLIFKVQETEGFSLVYGNPVAKAPQYDLSLVASKLLTASRSPAVISQANGKPKPASKAFNGIPAGALFWIALALVTISLLIVTAKLLPKPPEP